MSTVRRTEQCFKKLIAAAGGLSQAEIAVVFVVSIILNLILPKNMDVDKIEA